MDASKNPMISVIVPVYNGEKTIEKCLGSIMSQTYSDLEIVIINNASTDSSKDICNNYAKQDGRIRFYDCLEKGVSNARNMGLSMSTGKYITFVDCDDYVERDHIQALFDAMSQGVQMSICAYENNYEDRALVSAIPKELLGKWELKSSPDIVKLLYESYFLNALWNKLYLKEKITEGFCTDIECGEDILFNVGYLKNISGINVVPNASYHYTHIQTESITNHFNSGKFYQWIKVNEAFLEYYESIGGSDLQSIYHMFYDESFSLYWYMRRNNKLSQKEKRQMMSEFVDSSFVRRSIKHYKNTENVGLFYVAIKYRLKIIFYCQIAIEEMMKKIGDR